MTNATNILSVHQCIGCGEDVAVRRIPFGECTLAATRMCRSCQGASRRAAKALAAARRAVKPARLACACDECSGTGVNPQGFRCFSCPLGN